MRFMSLMPIVLAAMTGPALAADAIQSRNYPVQGFTKLRVEGPFGVHVRTGGKPGASARGPADRIDRLVIEVRGDTLVVTSRKTAWSWGQSRGNVEVNITVPALEAADLTGSGNVDIDRVRAGSFDASLGGSGNLTIGQVDTPRLKAGVTGSGNLSLRGRAGRAETKVVGSGDLLARGLAVDLLTAQVTGSGNIEVGPTRVARASITGSGDIRIGGRPSCTESKLGSGAIYCGEKPRK